MPGKTNGFCDKQDGGCTEVVKLEARMKNVEIFVEEHKADQRWHKRWQKTTTVGVYIAVSLLVLKLFILG